jgi:hypothetical protein
MGTANAKPRQSCRNQAKRAAKSDRTLVERTKTPAQADPPQAPGAHLSLLPRTDSASLPRISTEQDAGLSVRAENVLKVLAVELTGETPPQGRWIPSDLLLQRLTYKHLATTRNCGPQTTAEIANWARARGKIIRRSFPPGKSLSAMWQDAIAKFATGEISKAEVAEALERSMRRRNTQIPVALQNILLQLIRSSNG